MAAAAFASAQRSKVYNLVNDSIHATYASVPVGMTNGTGSYADYVLYKRQGDTAYSSTATVVTSNALIWRTIQNLQPSSTDTFRNVIVTNGVRDTTGIYTFTTKALVSSTLTSISVDTNVSPARVRFHFDITNGFSASTMLWLNSYGIHIQGPDLSGTGDTAISLAGYSVPDTDYYGNYLEVSLNATVSGVTLDSLFSVPDISIPALHRPTVSPIQVAQYQDSLVFTTAVTVGNAGYLNLVMMLYDSLTHGTTTRSMTVYHDTAFSIAFEYLNVNDGYSLTIAGTNAGGIATQTAVTHTLGLNPATLSRTVDTTNLTTTAVTISVTGNSNGTLPGNLARILIKYNDKNAVSHKDSSVTFTGMLNPSFNLANLKPGPASNDIWIFISNSGLGRTDSFLYQVTLLTPAPPRVAPAPYGTTPVMVNSSTIQWSGLRQNVDPGDTVGDGFVLEDLDGGGTDTSFTSGGLTSSTILGTSQFTGLIGGHTYRITPFSISADNQYNFGQSEDQYTNAPQNPIVEDILVDTANSRVKITVRANGQGTPSKLYLDIMQGTGTVHSYVAVTIGTGYVSYDYYPDQYLNPNTLYNASATIKDMQDDNPMQMGKDFLTPVWLSTGISQVTDQVQKPDFVFITNILGQKLFQGSYADGNAFAKGRGILVMVPTDKEGNKVGNGKQIFVE